MTSMAATPYMVKTFKNLLLQNQLSNGLKILCSLFYFLFYPITLEGRRGTTDEFATIPFHLALFSAVLVELAKSIPVHSLILSSHLFFCLPLFLSPFTVPCRIVFAKPEDLETWPNHDCSNHDPVGFLDPFLCQCQIWRPRLLYGKKMKNTYF